MTIQECTPAEDCLLLACDVAVRRALEVASKRMLTRRALGDQTLRAVPQYLIYTRLPVVRDTHRMDRLVDGAWTSLPEALRDVSGLVGALDGYVRSLLTGGEKHDPEYLRPIIRRQL